MDSKSIWVKYTTSYLEMVRVATGLFKRMIYVIMISGRGDYSARLELLVNVTPESFIYGSASLVPYDLSIFSSVYYSENFL